MNNQKLIEWIKNAKTQGYNSQKIYDSLVQQGYNPDEINYAIKIAFQTNPSSNLIKGLLPITIVVIIVIILISGGILFFNSQYKSDGSNAKVNLDSVDICDSTDCFLEKTSTCGPVNGTLSTTMNLNGALQTWFVLFELENVKTCQMVWKLADFEVALSSEMRETMASGGMSEDAIAEQEQNMIKGVSSYLESQKGIKNSCDASPAELEKLFSSWDSDGILSLSKLDCNTNNTIKETESSNSNSELSQKNSETEKCYFHDDCQEDYHCFLNSCVNNDILLKITEEQGRFSSDIKCEERQCANCQTGFKREVSEGGRGWDFQMNDKCVECTRNTDTITTCDENSCSTKNDPNNEQCKDGFTCFEYKCVKE